MTVRVPQPKTAIMAAMMSSNLNFQNWRKTDLANKLQVICGTFYQNRSTGLGCRDDPDRNKDIQTDRHPGVTHTHTHTHTRTYLSRVNYRDVILLRHLAGLWEGGAFSKKLCFERRDMGQRRQVIGQVS